MEFATENDNEVEDGYADMADYYYNSDEEEGSTLDKESSNSSNNTDLLAASIRALVSVCFMLCQSDWVKHLVTGQYIKNRMCSIKEEKTAEVFDCAA
jgi:hypothetical protein